MLIDMAVSESRELAGPVLSAQAGRPSTSPSYSVEVHVPPDHELATKTGDDGLNVESRAFGTSIVVLCHLVAAFDSQRITTITTESFVLHLQIGLIVLPRRPGARSDVRVVILGINGPGTAGSS